MNNIIPAVAANNRNVKVSVCMTTYNHENYIAQAIESVIMQKVNFTLELVIGEDCSTDNTRHICNNYKNRYPDIIRLLLNNKNQGLKKNFFNVGYNCKGKYIAYLEGDDYWSDPFKLQKQIDFLEANDDYGLIYTSFDRYDELKKEFINHICINEDDSSFESLLDENKIGALTTCFRKSVFDLYVKDVKPLEKKWLTEDYPLWLWISKKYKIKYLPDKTAIFRITPNSLSNQINRDDAFMFQISVMDIKYFFAKKQGKEYLFSEKYIRLKKYQLDYAFQIENKKMFMWAFSDLKCICPSFLTRKKHFQKLIIESRILISLYKKTRNVIYKLNGKRITNNESNSA